MSQNSSVVPERCRLILAIPPLENAAGQIDAALGAGDVASVILAREALEDGEYERYCDRLVPIIQKHGVAALVCDDTRVLGRSGADGIVIQQPDENYREIAARFSPQKIVGFGGSFNRHRALELGEANPDFMYFGKTDGDIRPEPHPKNLAIANWWSELVEIPCAVMGGSSIESIVECAASGAEFGVLGLAVFADTDGPGEAVRKANELLDEHAPIFMET
ncbi:MAG: thiamine phosphate synthase [Rhizobiaceae bacterium]